MNWVFSWLFWPIQLQSKEYPAKAFFAGLFWFVGSEFANALKFDTEGRVGLPRIIAMLHSMRRSLAVGFAVLLLGAGAPSLVQAAPEPVIVVGNYNLVENTPNQMVQIFVSGGQSVQGLDFSVQVADGGTSLGGTIVAPKITNVDIFSGTIFAGNNNPSIPGISSNGQYALATTTTAAGTVPADGLLATLTFDTTGFFATGPVTTFDLKLANLNGGATDTDFAIIPASITNGSIHITAAAPEPGSLVLLLCGGAGFFLVLRRKRAQEPSPA